MSEGGSCLTVTRRHTLDIGATRVSILAHSELSLATGLLPYPAKESYRPMTNANTERASGLESDVSATIVLLQQRFEAVRRAAIQHVRGRLGNLSPEQENAVDALTRGIIERVLQAPIANLKNAAAGDQSALVLKTLRTIFKLAT